MAVRVLLALAALAALYGCDQAGSPAERQEKQGGMEQAKPAPEPTTPTGGSGGVSGEERATENEADCRLVSYVAQENMSEQEASTFSERLADMIREMEDPSLSADSVRNAALDHFGVPRYAECTIGGG